MIHTETFPVEREEWEGRSGSPDACIYCQQTVGSDHASDCVKREKTVMLTMTITVMRTVPQNWDKEKIEFAHNEGSWCVENLIDELVERRKWAYPGSCTLCSCTDISFLRDATLEDEKDWYMDKNA